MSFGEHPGWWWNRQTKELLFISLLLVTLFNLFSPLSPALFLIPLCLFTWKIFYPWLIHPLEYNLPLSYYDQLYRDEYGVPPRHTARKKGDLSAYPPAFANGFYKLCGSHELPRGAVKSIRVLSRDLVLFRGQNGQLGLLDAYCPHLGANLGIGGVVVGDSVQCPFHGWSFDKEGSCTHIPGVDCIPSQAKTDALLVGEKYGIVYTWFDAEKREPTFDMEEAFPSATTSGWTYQGTISHTITCHQAEVPENGSDVAHLNHLHKEAGVTIGSLLSRVFGIEHEWTANWKANGISSCVNLTEKMRSYGREVPLSWQNATVTQAGPGFVFLIIEGALGRSLVIQTVTPVEPFVQRVDAMLFSEPTPFNIRIYGKFVLRAFAGQFERDVLIWMRKRYKRNPLLVKADGPIGKFRRWFSQFYSKNSPTIQQVRDNQLDW